MKVYKTEKIRNIAIASHQGTGKTSLAEAIVFRPALPIAWAR